MYDTVWIAHHGIKGQRWGVRRWQNSDGSLTPEGVRRYGKLNLRKSRTANIDKWGKDEDHNILYIAGYSGSGKSTTTVALARPNDKKIHLDMYSEPFQPDTIKFQDKDFNKYLDSKVPNWRKMSNATDDGDNGSLKKGSSEYWDVVDSFRNAIESYGKDQFKKGNRVIVEGVQVADSWLSLDLDYYKGKPTIVLGTNPVKSMKRALQRDDRGNLIVGLKSLDSSKEYIDWYFKTHKHMNALASSVNAKRGQKFVKELFKD